jgi:prepilin-type processing-associated H-X9-DG protein
LIGLLLPAVTAARAAARKVQCANNLRNVGLALLAEADSAKRFPAAGNFSVNGTHYHNWVVSILPRIEQGNVAGLWDFDLPHGDPVNLAVGEIHVPVIVCPEDPTTLADVGTLSYVVNMGIGWTTYEDLPAAYPGTPIDLNGNGIISNNPGNPDPGPDGLTDRQLFFKLNLFFVVNWPPGTGQEHHHSLDSILDGQSQTFLVSENVRAGADPYAPEVNWAWPRPERQAFLLTGYVCENFTCAPALVDYRRANDRSPGTPWATETINAGLDLPEGEAPWPSSHHVGGVNMMYADGHVTFLADTIDGRVYAAQFSPQGTTIKGALAQGIGIAE